MVNGIPGIFILDLYYILAELRKQSCLDAVILINCVWFYLQTQSAVL